MGVSIQLEFDRPDRTYRAGEPVGGLLRINTKGGGRCREIRLTHSWETQGPGNVDRGSPPTDIPLPQAPGPAESILVLPFEFPAPTEPLSYHGRVLEVDHYVKVEADIPGARDVGLIEQFVVVPGPLLGPPPTGLTQRHISWGKILVYGNQPPTRSQIGLRLLSPFLKGHLAELRLGSVRARLSSRVGVPGDPLDVEIRLSPNNPMRVNGASIELRAQEVWVSGTVAQANRTTNRNRVFSEVTRIPIPNTLGPGSLTTFRASTSIPDKGLYSFVLEENALVWEAVVRVDVPLWPDWEKVFPLLVWPAEGLEEQRPSVEEPEVVLESGGLMGPEVMEEPTTIVEPEDHPPPPSLRATEATLNLAEAVQAIKREEIFGGSRNRLIKDLLGEQVSFDLTVARIERTFAMYSDAAYRNGRTVTGTVSETGVEVRVWFPEVQNEVIDALERGSVHPVSGTVAAFDPLSLRPTIRADVSPEAVTEQA
jgi:hypothetical protein